MSERKYTVTRLEHDSSDGTWILTITKGQAIQVMGKPDPEDMPPDVGKAVIDWLYKQEGIDSGDAGSTKL